MTMNLIGKKISKARKNLNFYECLRVQSSRRSFLNLSMKAGASFFALAGKDALSLSQVTSDKKFKVSEFCRKLKPVGRVLEMEGWFVCCCTPIDGTDGKVHLFCSRWPKETKMHGWLTNSEIIHAIADAPEGPFTMEGVALKGSG